MSEENPELGDAEVAEGIEALADAVDAATSDALDSLEGATGISTRSELYREHGFPGETVTVEVELYQAELYATMDILDRITDGTLPARQFVPSASALSALIRASPSGAWEGWLAQGEVEMTDPADEERGE